MSQGPLQATTRPIYNGTPCVLWTGSLCNKGYGLMWWKGRHRRAHRVAYEKARGAIPPGMVLDHLCRNRSCTNPDHLEPVTNRVNIMRGEGVAPRFAARTHCSHGHEYTPENIKWRRELKTGVMYRRCRQCWLESKRQENRRRKARKLEGRNYAN